MGLLVLQRGVRTTIQDRGRPGYRGFGVPVGGAFDPDSLGLANALLGNEPDASALEMTLVGGTYRALSTLAIALAGAPMSATIRAESGPDRLLSIPLATTIQVGEELVIGGTPQGARTYLAVLGGWQTPLILGSRSTEQRLIAGEILPAEPGRTLTRRPVSWPEASFLPNEPIRVVDGPDLKDGSKLFTNKTFRVSGQSDRMGLRLEGPVLEGSGNSDKPSAPVAPGAIQVTGSGQAIILGVAGGTMGGYAHLAHVISADLARLGQLRPNDPITFQPISLDEARRVDRHDRLELRESLIRIRCLASSRMAL